MLPTVSQILELIDEMAPFDTQAAWDNAGLLAGHPQALVTAVLCALDLTPAVVREAQAAGANLIVTHHPVLFHARKTLREDDPEGMTLCALVRAHCALIAAHTNWDVAPGGVNDVLAETLGLTDIQGRPGDFLRIGSFAGTLSELAETASRTLGATPWLFGDPARSLTRVAVCGGAGGSLWRAAQEAGAQALLTGEVKHNEALDAAAFEFPILACGHEKTERICVKALKTGLQNRLFALQYHVRVFESAVRPF